MTAALTEHTGAPPDRSAGVPGPGPAAPRSSHRGRPPTPQGGGVPARAVPAPRPPWFPERDEAEHRAGGPAARIAARAPVEPGTGVPRRRRYGRVAGPLTGATRTRRGGRR